MQICVWFNIVEQGSGGSNTFLSALCSEFVQMGHHVTNEPTPETDIVLVNSWSRGQGRYIRLGEFEQLRRIGRLSPLFRWLPHWWWQRFPQNGLPIVHRVDGVAQLYGRDDKRADNTQFAIARQADHVIFQSSYAFDSFKQFGVSPSSNSVIHNAVDGNIFYPSTQKYITGQKVKLVANSWSMNPLKGFDWLSKLAAHPNVELSFIGRWLPEVNSDHVNLLGTRSSAEIGEILRNADAFVHASKNDVCPNVVLEALACGLPIIYNQTGGTKELSSPYGVPINAPIPEILEQLVSAYAPLRQKILADRSKFLIEYAAASYIKVFEQVKKRIV